MGHADVRGPLARLRRLRFQRFRRQLQDPALHAEQEQGRCDADRRPCEGGRRFHSLRFVSCDEGRQGRRDRPDRTLQQQKRSRSGVGRAQLSELRQGAGGAEVPEHP